MWFENKIYPEVFKNNYDKNKKTLIEKRYWQLNQIKNILHKYKIENISINECFKLFKTKISKRTFYNLKKEILFNVDRVHDKLRSFLGQNPIPKHPKYKYSKNDRQEIKEYTYRCLIGATYLDYTSVWLSIRKEDKLQKGEKYKDVSLSTFKKILREDPRFDNNEIKPYTRKHAFRTHVKELGHIQFDLKILGKYENRIKNKLPIFTMIDTSSRITFLK